MTEGELSRAEVRIDTDWHEPHGMGRCSAACISHGTDALVMALGDALDRSGLPRIDATLAALVADRQSRRGEVTVSDEILLAEEAFIQAAQAVTAAWRAFDDVRAGLADRQVPESSGAKARTVSKRRHGSEGDPSRNRSRSTRHGVSR